MEAPGFFMRLPIDFPRADHCRTVRVLDFEPISRGTRPIGRGHPICQSGRSTSICVALIPRRFDASVQVGGLSALACFDWALSLLSTTLSLVTIVTNVKLNQNLIDQISDAAANCTIGFAGISTTDNIEDVKSIGSGTLASVGSVKGILTAAHVLEALPDEGNVGLILHKHSAKPLVNMSDAHKLKIGGEASGKTGPDLGFLLLSPPTFTSLKARLSVCDLMGRRDDLSKPAAPTSIDVVVGIVAELTEELASERRNVRKFAFKAIFGPGSSGGITQRSEHDYFEFDVKSDPGFTLPSSYGGVSGGAIWRFYTEEKDGVVSMVSSDLIGVPFFETDKDGKMMIICHGTKSIYDLLVGAIQKEWPGAV
jgi:hypothetical protein